MSKPDFRERLRGDLEQRYEKLLQVIDGAMAATKKARVSITCKHCQRTGIYFVPLADTKAQIAAAEFFATQSLGRPGIADPEKGGQVVEFRRIVCYGGEDCPHAEAQSSGAAG